MADHQIWDQPFRISRFDREIRTAPVLAGDVLVFATETQVYGLSIYDGTIRWSYQKSFDTRHIVEGNGTVFFLGHVVDFYNDPDDDGFGDEDDDTSDTPPTCDQDPHPEDIAVTYVGLVALDASTGRLKRAWKNAAMIRNVREHVVDSDMVLLTTADGKVAGYDLHSGEQLWLREGVARSTPGPAGHGDGAVFFAAGRDIIGVNVRSGQQRFSFTTRSELRQDLPPQVGNGLVIAADADVIYALDWRTGELVWQVPVKGNWNTPVVSWDGNCLFATSVEGQAIGVELSTGKVFWQRTLGQLVRQVNLDSARYANGAFLTPVVNTDVTMIDRQSGHLEHRNRVFFPTASGAVVICTLTVDSSTEGLTLQERFKVEPTDSVANPTRLKSYTPAIGNGTVLLTDEASTISATSFEESEAVYFVNADDPEAPRKPAERANYLKIPANDQYAFGTDDFTLEAWVRTTAGGEVFSQSPVRAGEGNGFRLSIVNTAGGIRCGDFGEGRVQFSIADPQQRVPLVASTAPTRITDGRWHHLTLVRQKNTITIYVDGVSQPLDVLVSRDLIAASNQEFLKRDVHYFSPKALGLEAGVPPAGNAGEPLVVGAYLPSKPDVADQFSPNFHGLIADVRVWTASVTASQVNDRMAALLTGQEPGLVGYWPLNEAGKTLHQNLVTGTPIPAQNVVGAPRKRTNLKLDDSLFPYLLNHVTAQWPYRERWTVRGEFAPTGMPVSSGETLAFVTNNACYAIDLIHGKRRWGVEIASPSEPVADPERFYLLDDLEVQAYTADEGFLAWNTPLDGQQPRTSRPPVGTKALLEANGKFVIASADRRTVYWIEKKTGQAKYFFRADGEIRDRIVRTSEGIVFAEGGRLHLFPDPPANEEDEPKPLVPAATIADVADSPSLRLATDRKVLFVYDGRVVLRRNVKTLTPTKDAPWNPASLGGATVLGMAAHANTNRLVLTTNRGEILFWEFGSGKQLMSRRPDGLRNPSLYSPVIDEKTVFCTAKGILESTGQSGGGIWAYDLSDAELRGRDEVFSEPVSAPHIKLGTGFFGCHHTGDGAAPREAEALHSVVFGSTHALKRERNAAPLFVEDPGGVLDRTEAVDGERNGLDTGNFTLEAWVNTSGSGGEIFSSQSGVKGSGHAGFSLAVGPDGSITAEYRGSRGRSRFVSPPTVAAEGQWHHIAAVFQHEGNAGPQLCFLYLDGKPVENVKVSRLGPQPGPAARRIDIGGAGPQQFVGLLTDLRVWGTWLHAAEIATRRNVRLRGNEPELLANWTFADGVIHDHTANRLHNTQATGATVWLTELSFTAPQYPYLVAKSEPGVLKTRTLPEGHGETITTATFTTTINAFDAMGSPRPNTSIKLTTTEEIRLSGPGINPVKLKPGQSTDLMTGSKGHIKLNLQSTTDLEHSPVMWLQADFMYSNERFYVSPVVESQVHVVEPPPTLTAKSTMIEDYHYSPGDQLGTHVPNPGKDEFGQNKTPAAFHAGAQITTIHTTITANSTGNVPMPGESVEVWSEGHLTIESDGKTYSVNPQNSAKLKTGPDGTVTVILHENANPGGNLVNTPNLVARAGFMPRSSRFVIQPAEGAHGTLAGVTADQLKGKAGVPNLEKKKARLIPARQDANADAVAGALKQMMSLTKTVDRPSGQATGMANVRNLPSGAETHNEALLPADMVQAYHNSSHIDFNAPITPEYMPSPHFVMSFNDDGSLTHHAFDTEGELHAHLKSLGLGSPDTLFAGNSRLGADDPAGGWFKSLGEAISDGFEELGKGIETAWNETKHFVVRTVKTVADGISEVVHRVEVAITDTVNAIGTWVVKTVKDIADHVVAFLKKVEVFLEKIYDFLKALFDWKQIVEVHEVLRETVNGGIDAMEKPLRAQVPRMIKGKFDGLKDQIAEAMGLPGRSQSFNAMKQQSSTHGSMVASHTGSTKGNYMRKKMDSNAGDSRGGPVLAATSTASGASMDGNLGEAMQKLGEDLKTLFDPPGGAGSLSTHTFLQILDDFINLVIDIVETMVLDVVKFIDLAVVEFRKVLNAPLNIPFISALYKAIVGSDLSILDAMCLVLAVPVNIVLAIVDFDWKKDEIMNGVGGALARAAGQTGNAVGTAALSAFTKVTDIIYAVATFLYAVVKAANSAVVGLAAVASGGSPLSRKAGGLLATLEWFFGAISQIAQWIYRGVMDNEWKAGEIIGIGPLLMCLAIFCDWASKMVGMADAPPTSITMGLDFLLTLLGAFALILFIVVEVRMWRDKKTNADKTEALIGLFAGINLFCSFCLNSEFNEAVAAEAFGVPVPALMLSALDLTLYGLAPIMHFASGYGLTIWN